MGGEILLKFVLKNWLKVELKIIQKMSLIDVENGVL
jgi:hypothetical protein